MNDRHFKLSLKDIKEKVYRLKIFFLQFIFGYIEELACYFNFLSKKTHTPRKKFVIFGSGRTGSTLLVNILNANPKIHCDTEILTHRFLFPKNVIHCRSHLSKKEIYGFKLLSYQLKNVQKISHEDLFQYLLSKGYKFLYIKRSNLIRQSLSVLYANFRKKWHLTSNENFIRKKMYVDLEKLYHSIEEYEHQLDYEKKVLEGIPHISILYEKDLIDSESRKQLMKRLARVFNVQYHDPEINLVKITTSDFSGFIDNAPELIRYFKKTKYSEYIDSEI